jgi:DNA replication protein DnaC
MDPAIDLPLTVTEKDLTTLKDEKISSEIHCDSDNEGDEDTKLFDQMTSTLKKRWGMMNSEQRNVLKEIRAGKSVCISGSAGSGKTFVAATAVIWALLKKKKIHICASKLTNYSIINVLKRYWHCCSESCQCNWSC